MKHLLFDIYSFPHFSALTTTLTVELRCWAIRLRNFLKDERRRARVRLLLMLLLLLLLLFPLLAVVVLLLVDEMNGAS